jgi:hypothetical protein
MVKYRNFSDTDPTQSNSQVPAPIRPLSTHLQHPEILITTLSLGSPMPLIQPRLLAPDDASKRKEEKLDNSMWSNSFVFKELRDGFQPVFDRCHAKTTASSVRQADIGCKILRVYTNRQYRTVPGQRGVVKAISPDGKQARVLLKVVESMKPAVNLFPITCQSVSCVAAIDHKVNGRRP